MRGFIEVITQAGPMTISINSIRLIFQSPLGLFAKGEKPFCMLEIKGLDIKLRTQHNYDELRSLINAAQQNI